MNRAHNSANRISFMIDLHKSGSHGDITDLDRAKAGLACLIAARDFFNWAGNKRTAERCRAAISSARGAVRIQGYRETRQAEPQEDGADVLLSLAAAAGDSRLRCETAEETAHRMGEAFGFSEPMDSAK